MSPKTCLTLVLSLIGFLGLAFLAVSFIMTRFQKKNLAECTEKTEAEIIEVKGELMGSLRDNDLGKSWFPVYRYTANGKTHTVKSSVGGLETSYKVGQKVTLYYSPEDPEHIYVPGNTTEKIGLIFRLVGIGLLAAELIAVLIVLKVKK